MILAALGLAVAWMAGPAQAADPETVGRAAAVIEATYGDRAPESTLFHAALQGMASQLDELTGRSGHAVLTRAEQEEVERWLDGRRHGIAAEFAIVPGQGIVITDLYAGGPAERAGLRRGDLVVAMDDRPFTGLPGELILAVAGDRRGARVVLDVRRAEGLRRLSVERGPWRIDTAQMHTHNGVAVLRVPFFGPDTAAAVVAALADTPPDAPLVLDLRTNEGGRPEAAAKVAGVFVESGLPFAVSEAPDGSQTIDHEVGRSRHHHTGPIAVVVDRGTTGAAEAFVATLRHHRGAVVVGSTTSGQAGLPSWVDIGDGLVLQLVSVGLRDPAGRSWAPRGLEPDVMSQPVGLSMPLAPGNLPPDVQLDTAVQVVARTTEP